RMKKGGEYKITIPAQLGYGDRAVGPIPAGSTLHFNVTLLDFRSEAEVRAMQQQMQQQQQMMQQQQMPGGPGGAPGGPAGPPQGMPPQ
ncbi:MAG: peptidylprolyl isomerase, partial [Sphingomonadales bacterium]